VDSVTTTYYVLFHELKVKVTNYFINTAATYIMTSAGSALRGRLFRLTPNFFGEEIKLDEFLDEHVTPSKIVVLGETHGVSPIIKLQTVIQDTMAQSLMNRNGLFDGISRGLNVLPLPRFSTESGSTKRKHGSDGTSSLDEPRVRVVMEHFSVEMQNILDQYHVGSIDVFGLLQEYRNIGTENHYLNPYFPALESARRNQKIRLYGGFIPRTFARLLMKDGIDAALHASRIQGFIPTDESLQGTDAHYNFFEGLITGRNIHGDPQPGGEVADPPTDRFRAKMFPAQILKDASMAHAVQNILDMDVTGGDKVLVVCGLGHMLYSHGVPERIFRNNSWVGGGIKGKTLRVACLPQPVRDSAREGGGCPNGSDSPGDKFDPVELLRDAYGGPESDAADVCFMYVEVDSEEDDDDDNAECPELVHDQVRKETQEAYDKVGSTAHLEGGDMSKAHGILTSLHYTPKEIEYAGIDAVNYQGVGCPHRHAGIKEGDSVLDMGSGLGVDSLLAASAVGKDGRVVGVDLSDECVQHANRRAKERGIESSLRFHQSPIENFDERICGEEVFDVVISNGAFCLLPSKKSGFRNAFKVLKSGGRIAICTTVLKEQLEGDVEWPLCMETFAKLKDLEPMLKELGFVDIEFDFSDSLMEVEVEVDTEVSDEGEIESEDVKDQEEEEEGRYKVHNEEGQEQFRHLENVNMNDLCARVVIKARKP